MSVYLDFVLFTQTYRYDNKSRPSLLWRERRLL